MEEGVSLEESECKAEVAAATAASMAAFPLAVCHAAQRSERGAASLRPTARVESYSQKAEGR